MNAPSVPFSDGTNYQLPWPKKRGKDCSFSTPPTKRDAGLLVQARPRFYFCFCAFCERARAFLQNVLLGPLWPLTWLSRFDAGLLVKGVSFFFASTKMAETNQPAMADPSKNCSKVPYVLPKGFYFIFSFFSLFGICFR